LEPQEITISDGSINGNTLTVTPEAIFKEDEGESYIRITFELAMNISADKVVEFLMIFTTENDAVIDPVNLIYEDAVSCMMQ